MGARQGSCRPTKLFSSVEPADACQGALGDCWLMAALAAAFAGAMATHTFRNSIEKSLFELNEYVMIGHPRSQRQVKLANKPFWILASMLAI